MPLTFQGAPGLEVQLATLDPMWKNTLLGEQRDMLWVFSFCTLHTSITSIYVVLDEIFTLLILSSVPAKRPAMIVCEITPKGDFVKEITKGKKGLQSSLSISNQAILPGLASLLPSPWFGLTRAKQEHQNEALHIQEHLMTLAWWPCTSRSVRGIAAQGHSQSRDSEVSQTREQMYDRVPAETGMTSFDSLESVLQRN
ncbi:hypothetical protein P7K49_034019 [Saguinus oedipus]|uniref:Uncharacterized protein n=1 Tax=Saguinus oedipus TaxID=9490 RepID=A0ABQ9TTJ1_SAGOE|nr:hypothetical protein P7K49_034019 [Saguinus oedipus]